MRIIRKELAPIVAYAFPTRYDDTSDEVQTSYDGGETWERNDDADPRKQNQFAPLDTSDPRCDAAARITAAIDEQFNALADALAAGAVTWDLGNIVFAWLAIFAGFALLALLVAAFAAALFSIGSNDVSTAYNNMDWDDFKCAVRKYLNADGVMTEAGLSAFRSDYVATLTTTQQNIINGLLDIAGYGALNGFASTRSETGDCTGCSDGWSHTFYADSPELNWWFPTAPVLTCSNTMLDFKKKGVTESDGAGHLRWLNELNSPGGYILFVAGQIVLPAGCTLTAITWNATQIVGGNLDSWHKFRTVNQYRQCWTTFYTGFNQWSGSISGAQPVDWLIQWYNGSGNGGQVRIDSMTISGTGVDPFV